ncbi:hypothetical protein JRO89_XS03G0331600 [Xanthoceras sorbifolium]|uniref:Pectinesterase catalytic domain-containing protein n=1 Tax=Xanthoceras sorbifolium TaxID=99658 RepID=A0ABQ8IDG9_9ROSI|nr:hypothetical protein JRO89_XS03G0331600 [Xanthoceras sorbifolium]
MLRNLLGQYISNVLGGKDMYACIHITIHFMYIHTTTRYVCIHNCTIVPTPELASRLDVKTYLGRPWKKFSRTIIMESYLDGFIDREGWSKFDDKSDLSSLYYAEYNNRGKGAFTNGRVKWPGYHILKNSNDVKHFTVDKFINGSEWLPALDVPYIGGLIG